MKKIKILLLTLSLMIGFHAITLAQEAQSSDSTRRDAGLGPQSVPGQINSGEQKDSQFLNSYFQFKQRLKQKSAFTYSIDYFSIYQVATASLAGMSNEAFDGVFRVFGTWDLVGKKSGNKGSLIFKVENRHRYGNYAVAQDLGANIGYLGLTAVPFKDMGWGLTNFYWQQSLLNNQLTFVAGLLDPADFLNVYGLVDPWNDFYNLSYSSGTSIIVPDQGLGLAVRGLFANHWYVLAGVQDANGDPTDPLGNFESFFGTAEFVTHAEAGWIGNYDTRFSDNIHLTFWSTSSRELAGTPKGWGLNFSFSRMYGPHWQPFLRLGYAKDGGAFCEQTLDAGFGYKINKNYLFGFGAGFGKPQPMDEIEFDNQYQFELYCKMSLLSIFTLTPDIQLLINPAMNPTESIIAVFGLRGRVAI